MVKGRTCGCVVVDQIRQLFFHQAKLVIASIDAFVVGCCGFYTHVFS